MGIGDAVAVRILSLPSVLPEIPRSRILYTEGIELIDNSDLILSADNPNNQIVTGFPPTEEFQIVKEDTRTEG